MKLVRIDKSESYLHDGRHPHRQLHCGYQDGVFKLGNDEVVLSQMTPRGLWRFTGMHPFDDRVLDAAYGEMPLRIALVKLRLHG